MARVTYNLCAGLNAISLPLKGTGLDNADLLLTAICGAGEADVLWELLYDTLRFQSWTNLDTPPAWATETAMPFWVNIYSPFSLKGCTWRVNGLVPANICYHLRPGLNLIAIPIYTESLVTAEDLLADIPDCTAVWRWKRQVDCNQVGFDGFFWISGSEDNFILLPGYAYWIMYSGISPIDWCPPDH